MRPRGVEAHADIGSSAEKRMDEQEKTAGQYGARVARFARYASCLRDVSKSDDGLSCLLDEIPHHQEYMISGRYSFR